jgi:hypothetical protein
MKHRFRHPEKFQQLQFRDWIRENMPHASEGYVVEDIDLVLRAYGANYYTDAEGIFMLIELKFGNAWVGTAQQRTFGMIHKLLRKADPEARRYLGYFVIQYDNEDWDKANFKINGVEVDREKFWAFMNFMAPIKSVNF